MFILNKRYDNIVLFIDFCTILSYNIIKEQVKSKINTKGFCKMDKLELKKIIDMNDNEVIEMLTDEQKYLLDEMFNPTWIFGDLYRDASKNSGDDEYMHPQEFFKFEYESYLEREEKKFDNEFSEFIEEIEDYLVDREISVLDMDNYIKVRYERDIIKPRSWNFIIEGNTLEYLKTDCYTYEGLGRDSYKSIDIGFEVIEVNEEEPIKSTIKITSVY